MSEPVTDKRRFFELLRRAGEPRARKRGTTSASIGIKEIRTFLSIKEKELAYHQQKVVDVTREIADIQAADKMLSNQEEEMCDHE